MPRWTDLRKIIFFSTLALSASGEALAAQESDASHTLSIGGYLSRGEYGLDRDTDIVYLPVSYEYARFPWRAGVTVPWLSIEGPGGVFPQTGSVRPRRRGGRPPPPEISSESGLGDVTLSLAYQPASMLAGLAYMELGLHAKLPSADEERGLGTGETDYSAQLDVFRTLDRTTWYSTLGYTARGRTPLYNLKDSLYFSLGVMREFTGTVSAGLRFDYSEAASEDVEAIREFMPFVSWSFSERTSLMLYTVLGTTDSSPDRTAGLQLNWSFR